MKGRLMFGVIALTCAARSVEAQFQNAESVAILGCRRMVADEVRRVQPTADTVIFTLYPQVFPRTTIETDLVDAGQYFDRVLRLWVAFGFTCTYNFQSSAARFVVAWAGSTR